MGDRVHPVPGGGRHQGSVLQRDEQPHEVGGGRQDTTRAVAPADVRQPCRSFAGRIARRHVRVVGVERRQARATHAGGPEDAGLEVLAEREPRRVLDRARQQVETERRVAVGRARLELERIVLEHDERIDQRRVLDAGRDLAGVLLVVPDPGGVGQQLLDGDRRLFLGKGLYRRADVVIESDGVALDQLHHGDGGDALRDRVRPVGGRRCRQSLLLDVRESHGLGQDDLTVRCDRDRHGRRSPALGDDALQERGDGGG